jgi:hypothetical protein
VKRVGRRTWFFLSLAVVCLLLLEPTPDAYRWVNLVTAGVATFWGIMLFLEERSFHRSEEGAPPDDEADLR